MRSWGRGGTTASKLTAPGVLAGVGELLPWVADDVGDTLAGPVVGVLAEEVDVLLHPAMVTAVSALSAMTQCMIHED